MSAEQRGVFVEILFLANWKPQQARWKAQWYEVQRGELSHSLTSIASSAGTSVKVVRTALVALMAKRPDESTSTITERYPILGTGPGTGPRVLTVVNYSKYQDVPDNAGTGTGTGRARVGHGSGTGGAQREEGEAKEERNLAPLFAEPVTVVKVDAAPAQPRKRKLSPQGEAWEHWREHVWWRLSTDPCPALVAQTAVLLADRCHKYGVDGVKAAMDRVVVKLEGSDQRAAAWLRENLTLAAFCADGVFPKFLARAPAPVNAREKTTAREITGFDTDGMPTYAEKSA